MDGHTFVTYIQTQRAVNA